MVSYRRNRIAGGTYFFTVTLQDRRASWLTSHASLLRSAVSEVRARRPFEVVAMVVMPDHLHTIWRLPDGDADYTLRWREIKSAFTRRLLAAGVVLPRNRSGRYSLWQPRYWEHTVRDDADLNAHIDYIHANPLKHGLVKRVADWPYSSFHSYMANGCLPVDWAGGAEDTQVTGDP